MTELDINANNYINDPQIELHWAAKAFQHAEIHFNLLCAIDSKFLKLTKIDEIIYNEFRALFKDFPVDKIDVDHLKSDSSKELWRPFCESYKEKVEDYNMATLLRVDATLDYTEENTTLVPRIQFYAIEIARNREGHNQQMYNIRSEENDFKQRSKCVFDTLSNLESSHKAKEIEYTKEEEIIEEVQETFKLPDINEYKRKAQKDNLNQNLKHQKKQQPDYVVNPDKWKKYSLADVDESQLSQKANYNAAMSFLNINSQQIEANEQFKKLAERVEFNKPIGNKKYMPNLAEEVDEEEIEKIEIDRIESQGFKKKTRSRAIRKKDPTEDKDDEVKESVESIAKLRVSDKSKKEDFDEFNKTEDVQEEEEYEDFVKY